MNDKKNVAINVSIYDTNKLEANDGIRFEKEFKTSPYSISNILLKNLKNGMLKSVKKIVLYNE